MSRVAAVLFVLFALTSQPIQAQQPKPLKEIVTVTAEPGLLSGSKGQHFVMSVDGKWFAIGWKDLVRIYSLPDAKVVRELTVIGFPKLTVYRFCRWWLAGSHCC